MGKRKEIKFRRDRRVYEGRQNGVIFRLYEDREKIKTCAPAYSVTAVDTKNEGREICTAGHQYFHMDAAKEFCQQIAAGEIDLETLQEKFAAEDAAREQEAIRADTERAKKFRTRLEAAGISYMELLELEALRANLGGLAHNILIGYERGEGWPNV